MASSEMGAAVRRIGRYFGMWGFVGVSLYGVNEAGRFVFVKQQGSNFQKQRWREDEDNEVDQNTSLGALKAADKPKKDATGPNTSTVGDRATAASDVPADAVTKRAALDHGSDVTNRVQVAAFEARPKASEQISRSVFQPTQDKVIDSNLEHLPGSASSIAPCPSEGPSETVATAIPTHADCPSSPPRRKHVYDWRKSKRAIEVPPLSDPFLSPSEETARRGVDNAAKNTALASLPKKTRAPVDTPWSPDLDRWR